jgi:subtilisin-like proprotein convertase family protein
MRFSTLTATLLLLTTFCHAQLFTGGGGPIPDDGSTTDFPLLVNGLQPGILDTISFGVETICIDLVHTWNADLEISLVAPDGTTVPLTIGNGGADDNYTNTCFNAEAPTSIVNGSSPFTGTFRPQGQLGYVNNGQNGNGTWALRIYDNYAFADAGTLFSWSITFGPDPASYFTLSSSTLPIMVINTNGQTIPDDPKIMADMGIIWNGPGAINTLGDPFNHYHGKIGIERRGFSSNSMPKRSYSMETWDLAGNSINVPLFGLPQENDWVLSAGYSDKTLMRNALTYGTARTLGQWAPRTMHVDVVLDGQYIGVYTFCERVKRDNGRVNIARLQPFDLEGDELTGGYIIKVDKVNGSGGGGWNSLLPPAYNPGGQPVYIQYHYPDDDDIMPQQAQYIRAYVDSFELALQSQQPSDLFTGYPHFIDEISFADYLLLTELVKNLDGYRSSAFYYKDKNSNGGKLKAGPAWDYDLSYGNGDFCNFHDVTGWTYRFGEVCPWDYWQVSGWWQKLMEDDHFQRTVRCRWEELKYTVLAPESVHARADSMAQLLEQSQHYNFIVWPIMGAYVWPNYYVEPDYASEVQRLKWFYQQRWNWIDANLPQVTQPCLITATPQMAAPAPFSASMDGEMLVLSMQQELRGAVVRVFDTQGRMVLQHGPSSLSGTVRLSLDGQPTGLYLVRVEQGGSTHVGRVVKAH